MSVIYVTTDLMFSSRVRGFAKQLGVALSVVKQLDEAAEQQGDQVTLAIFDLSLETLDIGAQLETLKRHAPECSTLSYGPHVHVDALKKAKDAGCGSVISNGEFNNNMAAILTPHADSPE